MTSHTSRPKTFCQWMSGTIREAPETAPSQAALRGRTPWTAASSRAGPRTASGHSPYGSRAASWASPDSAAASTRRSRVTRKAYGVSGNAREGGERGERPGHPSDRFRPVGGELGDRCLLDVRAFSGSNPPPGRGVLALPRRAPNLVRGAASDARVSRPRTGPSSAGLAVSLPRLTHSSTTVRARVSARGGVDGVRLSQPPVRVDGACQANATPPMTPVLVDSKKSIISINESIRFYRQVDKSISLVFDLRDTPIHHRSATKELCTHGRDR